MALSEIDIQKLRRYLSGTYTKDEEKYISGLFADPEKEQDLTRFMRMQWYQTVQVFDDPGIDTEEILGRIHDEIGTADNNPRRSGIWEVARWLVRVAAVLFIPLAIYSGLNLRKGHADPGETWVEIKAPSWSRVQFLLPDSTTGWLAGNSTLRYSGNFTLKRNVVLEGEAFFDVYTDKHNPFVVNANDMVVTAKGTRFNVSSYGEDDRIEVVLEEGRLEVERKYESSPMPVLAGELVTFDKRDSSLTREYVQASKYIAWTEGKLVFRNDPLDVVARRLERWYNVNIELEGNSPDSQRLRATFIDENLEEVLYYLKRTMPLNYNIVEGNLQEDDSFKKKKVFITLI